MRKTIVFTSLSLFLLSCGQKVNLAGTYVRSAEGLTGMLYDTLFIEPTDNGGVYKVVRRTAVRKENEIADVPGKRTNNNYTGTFDEKSSMLQLNDPSKSYLFNSSKHTLTLGELTYSLLP